MLAELRPTLVFLALFTAITGALYPLAITGIGQALFHDKANGSLLQRDGKVIGSSLIGQSFADEKYFHGRPSATSAPDPKDPSKTVDAPYNAAASSGSNLGPISVKLSDRLKADVEAVRKSGATGPIPADSVTTSASGLDPHISVENALLQVPRVAKSRNLTEAQVRQILLAHAEARSLGVIGEPRVNVLAVNLALDGVRK